LIPDGKFKDYLRYVRRAILRRRLFPSVGKVDLGDLDRSSPVSDNWGFDRGTPVDRLYIEDFIADCQTDIRGRVLEVYNNDYTSRFGGDRVSQSDILHDTPDLARATLVLDLTRTDEAPSDLFDCIICTQTLHLIYDISAAIRSLHKLLKPKGILLFTAPGISATPHRGMGGYPDFWRFTSYSVRRLFKECFDEENLDIRSYGNVYAATAFLHGLAVEELDQKRLSYFDPDYEMLISLRATKRPES
jgi:SAM-dependent methyltransferase